MAFKENEQIYCTECSQTVLAGDVMWATTWVHIKTHSKMQGREAGMGAWAGEGTSRWKICSP